MMNLLDNAIIFAVKTHTGTYRKTSKTPYIVHPMEACAIAATMTEDEEILAAAVLHDVVEDCGVDPKELGRLFGPRVQGLVESESEDKRDDRPKGETWRIRKEESLKELEESNDPGCRIIWLSDKLSNIRSFYRAYEKEGAAFWNHLNMKDPNEQYWYYSRISEILSPMKDYPAWQEYDALVRIIFKDQIEELEKESDSNE